MIWRDVDNNERLCLLLSSTGVIFCVLLFTLNDVVQIKRVENLKSPVLLGLPGLFSIQGRQENKAIAPRGESPLI